MPYDEYNWEQILVRFLLVALGILEGVRRI